MSMRLLLPDVDATGLLATQLSTLLKAPLLVGLRGDLGAGKTTFVRAFVNALAPGTRVKSPTYTLVETYSLPQARLHHLDLYRLDSPDELLQLGLDDLLSEDALVLVEWPENGAPVLPVADLEIALRHLDEGREAAFTLRSSRAQAQLAGLLQMISIEGGSTASSS